MFSKLGNTTSYNYCISMGILSSAKRVDTEDSDGLDNAVKGLNLNSLSVTVAVEGSSQLVNLVVGKYFFCFLSK